MKISELKHDLYGNCAQNVLINILHTLGYDYSHLQCTGWSFHYINDKQLTFGERIDIYEKNFMDLQWFLSSVYNIRMKKHTLDSSQYSAFISNCTQKEQPVCLYVDSYFCDWQRGYRLLHNHHMIIVKEQTKRGYWCIDPYLNKADVYLSNENFFLSVKAVYVIEVKEKREICHNDIILNSAYKQLQCASARQIQEFARDILLEKALLIHELSSTEPAFIPVIRKITHIAYGRKSYLDYVISHDFNNGHVLCSVFKQVVRHWMKIMNLTIKTAITEEKERYIDDLSETLKFVIALENQAIELILDSL